MEGLVRLLVSWRAAAVGRSTGAATFASRGSRYGTRYSADEQMFAVDIASLTDIERTAILVHLAGNVDPMMRQRSWVRSGRPCCELVEVGE